MLFSGRKEETQREEEATAPPSAAKLNMHIARSYPFAQDKALKLEELLTKKSSDTRPISVNSGVSNARRGM